MGLLSSFLNPTEKCQDRHIVIVEGHPKNIHGPQSCHLKIIDYMLTCNQLT